MILQGSLPTRAKGFSELTRREREARERRRSNAAFWAEQYERTLPSAYPQFTSLQSWLEDPKPNLVNYARCSKREQRYSYQTRVLKYDCQVNGIKVSYAAGENCSGKSLTLKERPILYRCLEACRKFQTDLYLVDLTRLFRNPDNPSEALTKEDLDQLAALADAYGIRFVLRNDPDTEPRQGQAELKKLSKQFPSTGRPKKYGYGAKKRFREKFLPLARELRTKGFSYLQISREIQKRANKPTSKGTVYGWLNTR